MSRKPVPLVRLSVKGFKGFVREDLRDSFPSDFLGDMEAAVCKAGGRIIKVSSAKWVALLPGPSGHAFFVKKFRVKNWKERLRYLLLPSKAMKEWNVSLGFRTKGVRIPAPVGVMERRRWGFLKESLYISEAIEDTQTLMDFFVERFGGGDLEGREDKRGIVRLLGDTVRRFHDGGLFHADLQAGNFLIKKREDRELYVIDLHRARVRKNLSGRQRLWDIAKFFYSLNSMLDQGDKEIFLQAYGGNGKPFETLKPFFMSVERVIDKIKRRHQKSRAKKCLRESTHFIAQQWKGYRLYRIRDSSPKALMELIDAHREIARDSPSRLLRNSPHIVVSMVEIPHGSGRRTCVKQYRYVTAWSKIKQCFGYSKAKGSWIAANELFRQEISDLKPLAYVEKVCVGFLKESFFIMESPTDYLKMDRYLNKSFGNGRSGYLVSKERAFIQQLARWIGFLHQSGIFHSELKTCNILVRERAGRWDFGFFDLDGVRLCTKVDYQRVLRNLVQINCSVPGFFSYGARVRFLRWYLQTYPIALQKRDLISTILEESRKHGVVWDSLGVTLP